MINRVVLVGRTTKQPELRTTVNNIVFTEFTLAVNRLFKNKDGSRDADYIRCVAWRKTAEIIGKYVKKGSMISVDGRIQTRNYDDRYGNRVYITEVVLDNVSLLDPKGASPKNKQSNKQQSTKNSNPTSWFKKPIVFSGADFDGAF